MKLILTHLFFLITSLLFSQNATLNRDAFLLKLPINKPQFYKQNVKASPYFVKAHTLQLYTGEKLFIEIETTNNSINAMTVVRENLNPEKTIEVELYQKTEGRLNKGITLKLKKPFEKDIEYKTVMLFLK